MADQSYETFALTRLCDEPSFAPVCAAWAYGQWGSQVSGGSLARAQARFAESLQRKVLPVTLVAHTGSIALGMASLWTQDPPARPDLTPWLASVYVHPFHRGRGIAQTLVQGIEDEARRRGFMALYLVTEDASGLYQKLGWRTLEPMESVHGPCDLMTKTL